MTSSNHFPLGLGDRDQLDKALGGGIPQSSIVLLEGEYGAGKSVMSQRIAYGLCETGRTVTYLSTELTFRGFVNQMHSLSYPVESHILDERLTFLPANLETQGRAGNGSGERKKLLQRLMDAERMWDADVVIIDTFDAILRNDPTFEMLIRKNDERQAALEIISFFRRLASQGKDIVLTVDPTTVDDETIGPFRAIADVYLDLEMVHVGNDVRRHISVRRFAGMGEQVGDTIGYSVRSGTGVVIESRSVT